MGLWYLGHHYHWYSREHPHSGLAYCGFGGLVSGYGRPSHCFADQSLTSEGLGLGVKSVSSGEGRELNNILTAGYWKSLIQGILWLSFKDNPSENIDKLGTFLALLLSHSISPAQEM